MSDFLVCEECNKGEAIYFDEENKVEETICVFCKYGEAETLVEGQAACITCKMNKKSQNKSPAGSIRSETDSQKGLKMKIRPIQEPPRLPPSKNIADQLKQSLELHNHKRGDSSVSVEFYKAHKFLQSYVSGSFNELFCLYNTKNDGFSSTNFHSKCDDCKSGLIIIITLSLGYEIAAFTWRGIRRGLPQATDSQMGGGFIRDNKFELVPFRDNIIYSVKEGVKFSSENDLYLNFDVKEKSICNFDARLKGNRQWTTYIEEISVYKLQVSE